jgi:hypothetical protein
VNGSAAALADELARAHGVLMALVPSDDRDEWIEVGAALYHETEGSEDGREVWEDWSAKSEKFDPKAIAGIWDSFERDGGPKASFGKIYFIAEKYGWKPKSYTDDPGYLASLEAEAVAQQQRGNGADPHKPSSHDRSDEKPGPRGKASNSPDPDVISLADLENEIIEPLRWIVPDYIPEGLTVFAGRPKIGKSWLMLGVALAVARGRETLGQLVEKGEVLYCGLEDGKRRMQSRVTQILGPAIKGWPANFSFRRKLAPLDQGGLDTIEQWLFEHPNRRLVVIDVLGRVRGAKRRDEDAYSYDYRLLAALQELAIRYRVAIVVVHHVRKADAEDVLDTINGTTGIAGAADTALVLGRTKNGVRLAGRGRDTEDVDKLVEFDPETGIWAVTGDYDEAVPDSETASTRRAVFDLLDGSPVPLKPPQIAERLKRTGAVVRVVLSRMLKAVPSQVQKNPDGSYTTPRREAPRGP